MQCELGEDAALKIVLFTFVLKLEPYTKESSEQDKLIFVECGKLAMCLCIVCILSSVGFCQYTRGPILFFQI